MYRQTKHYPSKSIYQHLNSLNCRDQYPNLTSNQYGWCTNTQNSPTRAIGANPFPYLYPYSAIQQPVYPYLLPAQPIAPIYSVQAPITGQAIPPVQLAIPHSAPFHTIISPGATVHLQGPHVQVPHVQAPHVIVPHVQVRH